MSVALPELASVRVHERSDELVVEIEVPDEVDLSRLSVQRADGVIEIRLPRTPRQHERIPGFHPDASGV